MKTLLSVLLASVMLAACAADDAKLRTYANSDLELVVGNAAKMSCTCLFVMEMGDEYCANWVRASPDIGRFSVDKVAKRVESSSFISWAATARYVDEKRGCVLE